jgi:hemolysin activation/secretion protein
LLHNNLTRNDDILSYKYNCSDNSNSEGHTLNYSIPFNYYLSEFSYSGSYSRTRLTGASEDLLAGGDSYTVSFSVNHRFFATPKWEFSGKLGFDAKRSTTDMMSTLVYKDSLRILNTSFTLTESDGKGTTSIVNAGYFGFCDFMGASSRNNPLSSKFPANGQFVKYTGSVTRYHIIPFSSTLTVSGDIQLTPDNLTSLEQYSLGGAGSIRGYPPSEYTSDYGWKVITEIKSPFFILPKWALPANLNRDSVFSLVTFFDFGKGYLRNPAATARTDRVLKSAGVGLRCYLFNNDLSMSADFAWPLGPKPTDKLEGGRVHYSVTWEF